MHQGGAVERAIGGFREHASAGFDDGEIGNHDSFARRQGGLDIPNRCIAPAQDGGEELLVICDWLLGKNKKKPLSQGAWASCPPLQFW
jgi:hypothetical protein